MLRHDKVLRVTVTSDHDVGPSQSDGPFREIFGVVVQFSSTKGGLRIMSGAPTPTKFSGTFRSFGGGSESRDLKSSATGKAPEKSSAIGLAPSSTIYNQRRGVGAKPIALDFYGTAGR